MHWLPAPLHSAVCWPVFWVTLALSAVGMLMMVSAGGGDMALYAWPQLMRLLPALLLMGVVAWIPLRLLMQYAYLVYFSLLLVLIAVELVGHTGMGAQRWLKVGMVNIQPSELMKIGLILALARYFHPLQPEQLRRIPFLLAPLVMIAAPAALILRQPNLGTATVLIAVGGALLFLAGLSRRYLIAAILLALVSAPLAWHFLHDYQQRRVLTFLDPERDPLGAGYNILQSMIAIGSGGLAGKGFLQGSQGQLDFLPEKHTDFIFTMLAEEWGFLGGAMVLLLYAGVVFMSMAMALRSKSVFGAMIAAGVGMLLFVHVMMNVAMVMGLIPVVGVPLPLLSYGGSITLSTLIAIGLLLNIYAHRHQQPVRDQPRF